MIEPCISIDQPGWMDLRLAQWPHATCKEHLEEMNKLLAQPERYAQFIYYADHGIPAGLLELSLRGDYVNGTETSPVAFVEGLYVVPSFRMRGIARELVGAAVEWALAQGCLELASDAVLDNLPAQIFHKAIGFEETEKVVYFRRRLSDAGGKR